MNNSILYLVYFGIGQSRHTRLAMLTVRDLSRNKTISVNFNLLFEGQGGHNTGQKGHNTGRKGHCRDKRDKTRSFRTKGDNRDILTLCFFSGGSLGSRVSCARRVRKQVMFSVSKRRRNEGETVWESYVCEDTEYS